VNERPAGAERVEVTSRRRVKRLGGWQWGGGSGSIRKRRSVRSVWYRLERGSGSIDSVVKV
jgi:hypothetical protein